MAQLDPPSQEIEQQSQFKTNLQNKCKAITSHMIYILFLQYFRYIYPIFQKSLIITFHPSSHQYRKDQYRFPWQSPCGLLSSRIRKRIILNTQRMFSGLSEQPSSGTGKRIYGLPSRREAEFSIGWSNSNQLNDFQMRKSKNKEVTGKITTQAIIQGQDLAYQQHRQANPYDPPARDPRDYAPPAYENLSQEELDKLMQRYEDYRAPPSQDYRGVPSRKEERLSENGNVEKRAPIRPRESMKDIIYNGVGVADEGYQKAPSRQRTNSKGSSNNYNYYGRN